MFALHSCVCGRLGGACEWAWRRGRCWWFSLWACRRLQARNIHKDILFLVLFFVVCFIYAFSALLLPSAFATLCHACSTVHWLLHCALLHLLCPLCLVCTTVRRLPQCALYVLLYFVCPTVPYFYYCTLLLLPHCARLRPLCLFCPTVSC